MNKKDRRFVLDFFLHFSIFIAAFIHFLVSLSRRFLAFSGLQPFDYIPGICAALIAVILSFCLIINSRSYFSRFRIGYLLLIAIMLLYLHSCVKLSEIKQLDMFDENKLILYDTFVLFFFVYPLGHYIAKWKESVLFRAFLNIFLFAVSIYMLIVIIHVFQGKTIEVPSGSPIQMTLPTSTRSPYYRLAISCNPNGSGSAEAIAFLTSLVLLFRNTTIPGKVLAVFFALVNYTGLVLTGSRTALTVSLIGSIIMVFLFCTSSRIWRQSASTPISRHTMKQAGWI